MKFVMILSINEADINLLVT